MYIKAFKTARCICIFGLNKLLSEKINNKYNITSALHFSNILNKLFLSGLLQNHRQQNKNKIIQYPGCFERNKSVI